MSDGKVNILIVDDKPDKLLALEVVLEDLQANIVRAYSGRDALRALLSEEFAVILLDVNMPGMDGFETASLIRQRKSSEKTPIIFVTAFGDENHSHRGYSLGAVDYIQTPVMAEVLRTKVAVFVDLYKKTEQVRRQAQSLQQRADQLHKLTAASLAINSALSMENMLKVVTETARDIISAQRASTTVLPDDNWAHAQTHVSASEKHAAWREGDQRLDGGGIESIVCRHNKPARMTQRELEDEPLWQLHGSKRRPFMRGWLAAPLTGRDGRNFGLIELTDKGEGDFTGDDETLLTQLAQMASIAIENTFYAEEREANRIKDEFLSTLSHELRTPLNAILGWTQLMRLGNHLDGDTAHAIEVIERNARAQAKLVEDLLDVSRVTTGKLRLNMRPLNLWSLVTAAVDALRPNAEAKNIALDLSCGASESRVNGDPDRLQQVAWNLLSNAIKFTPEGGRVEIRLDRSNEHLRLRISDTGQGISANFLPYVFDRFRQADSTSTRSHGGLGIGLTIVRHIVEIHGGKVRAESPGEGMGATFSIDLPVSTQAEHQNAPHVLAPAGTSEERPQQQPADLSGISVLLVDDEQDAREVIAEILRRTHARVIVASCVQEALSAIAQDQPNLVISDIAMPGQDGFDLLRILRQLPCGRGGDVPVIALTAYAREEDRMRSIASGFQGHLAKPVSPHELIATVAHLCAKQSTILAG